MTRRQVARALREKVVAAAGERCGYCLTSQAFTAMPLHLEHIIPIAVGGPTTEVNLWLACALCNGYKGARVEVPDPESGAVVFQMSAEDSASLNPDRAAGRMGPNRALFYSEDEGRLEKFRPYALPDESWLAWVGERLRARGTLDA